ncbi:eukaryotic DNA primase small subunit [Pandoravirus inopinatum]|uniref:Eukaryotic DNA primase small subunit n=1 Tax=Pandoravirus inopinatum TaxID=1605721 RepID=A0A0B5J356_9VIRU|nr:eukaryotic DNA primase small subunit [Pandoravirus inopinatum]AJF98029.1 eukaryotic DNA primase small subunit [Pandoravirus inopinatum]
MDLSMNLVRLNKGAGKGRADALKALANARSVRPSPVNATIAAVRAGMDADAAKSEASLTPTPSDMHRRFRDPDPLATSVLKAFLGRRGCLVKRGARKAGASDPTARPTTALLKDGWGGGVVSVSDEDYAAFLDAYGDDVLNGVRHAVCEQRSDVFRMHLDIDLSVPRAADRRAVLTLVRLIQAITAHFFPGVSRRVLLAVIVLAAQEKPLGDGRGVKQGIHIVMPNLYVNWRQALDMRECYVTLLKRAYGPDARGWAAGDPPARSTDVPAEPPAYDDADATEKGPDCTWEKVIDHNVFTFNGLRMPYSHNVIRCPTCKGAKPRGAASASTVPCAGPCNGTGKCWEPRWYEPVAYLDGDGTEDPTALDCMADNPHHCLLRTSIRCRADQALSPGWTCFAGAPRCNVATLDPAWHKYQERLAGGGTVGGARSVPNTVAPDDPRFARMATLIRAKGHAPHARVDVHSIRRDRRGNYYIIQIDGEGSRACLNMPPEPDRAPSVASMTMHACFTNCRARASSKSATAAARTTGRGVSTRRATTTSRPRSPSRMRIGRFSLTTITTPPLPSTMSPPTPTPPTITAALLVVPAAARASPYRRRVCHRRSFRAGPTGQTPSWRASAI